MARGELDDGGLASGGGPERFIPLRRRDLLDALEDEERLTPDERDGFRPFAELLNAIFHHEYHSRLETLKDAYAPFHPDPDTRVVRTYDDGDRREARRALVDGLRDLLDEANFEPIPFEEVETAFEEESLVELDLEIDRSEFEEVLFFRRGETQREETVSEWFGLRERTVTFTNYEKVLIYVSFKDTEHLSEEMPDELPYEPGATTLKLFQDVPRADLEMLFPNAQPRMRRIDKVLIGVPAAISGIIIASTRLATTVGLVFLLLGFWLGFRDERVELDQTTLVTLGAGLGSLGGYLMRQFTKYKSRQMQFMRALAENLYFRNLDNDEGVFHHLLDAAEEEEVKEATLAWYFLRAADGPLTAEELDETVEDWFRERWDHPKDFEVRDGIDKLRVLELVEDADGDRMRAVPSGEAIRRLDARWDAYFEYAERDEAATG